MFVKAIFALVLALAFAQLHAQEASPLQGQEQFLDAAAMQLPSMAALHSAFVTSRLNLSQVSTRVFLKFDSNGKVLEAKVSPSTRDRALDKAIVGWARQIKLKPGTAGTGYMPIELSKSR